MFRARLVFASFGSALTLAVGVGCSEPPKSEFTEGGGTTGGVAGVGVSGAAGTSGSAGSTSPTGGAGGASAAGQGGASASGGSPMAGMSGSTPGGAGAGPSGGAAGGGGMAPTTGCGAATWPPGDGATLQSISVDGTPREYIVQIPANYDTNHPYRLVFAWHGRTGTAAMIARNFYGLESPLGESTVFVSGQGLGTDADPADTGWPNTNGRDIAFVRALLASLSSSYCIDQTRIMSVGMSYGGIMSYHIACQMSDVFRAVAPIAGAAFGGRGMAACNAHSIALWAAHGTADDQVMFADGESAKNRIVALNHCQATTQAVEPSPCVQYDGCDAGYPVVWCVHDGGHTIPQWSGAGIAAFFAQF